MIIASLVTTWGRAVTDSSRSLSWQEGLNLTDRPAGLESLARLLGVGRDGGGGVRPANALSPPDGGRCDPPTWGFSGQIGPWHSSTLSPDDSPAVRCRHCPFISPFPLLCAVLHVVSHVPAGRCWHQDGVVGDLVSPASASAVMVEGAGTSGGALVCRGHVRGGRGAVRVAVSLLVSRWLWPVQLFLQGFPDGELVVWGRLWWCHWLELPLITAGLSLGRVNRGHCGLLTSSVHDWNLCNQEGSSKSHTYYVVLKK